MPHRNRMLLQRNDIRRTQAQEPGRLLGWASEA